MTENAEKFNFNEDRDFELADAPDILVIQMKGIDKPIQHEDEENTQKKNDF